MTKQEKLEYLKSYLDNKHIKYIENYDSGFGIIVNLRIPRYRIVVIFSTNSPEGDTKIFRLSNGKLLFRAKNRLLFIRDTETPEFIIEKAENLMTASREQLEKHRLGKLHNEECMKRHEEKVAMWEQKRKEREESRARRIAEEETRKAEELKPKRRRVVITHYEPISHK